MTHKTLLVDKDRHGKTRYIWVWQDDDEDEDPAEADTSQGSTRSLGQIGDYRPRNKRLFPNGY